MYKTLGFSAQLATGKDTIADYITTELNKQCKEPWKRNAFANKVKEVFQLAFRKDRAFIEEWKRIEEPPPGFLKNIRQCLIGIGDGFRQMCPDIWLELAFHNQNAHQCLADLRYLNECKKIYGQDGIVVLMWRKGYVNNIQNDSEQQVMPYVNRCLEWGFEGLIPSSWGIPFDLFIKNEGTLTDLYEKADNIIIPYIKQKWKNMF